MSRVLFLLFLFCYFHVFAQDPSTLELAWRALEECEGEIADCAEQEQTVLRLLQGAEAAEEKASIYLDLTEWRENKGVMDVVSEGYYKAAIATASDLGDECLKMKGERLLVRHFYFVGENQRALNIAQDLFASSKGCDEEGAAAKGASFLGFSYSGLGQYDLALRYMLEADSIERANDNQLGIAGNLLNLAIVYSEIDDTKNELKAGLEAIEILKRENPNSNQYAGAVLDVSSTYNKLNRPDTVLLMMAEIEPILSAEQDVIGEITLMERKSMAFLQLQRYDEARTELNSGIAKIAESEMDSFYPQFYAELTKLENEVGNKQKALDYARQTIEAAQQNGELLAERDAWLQKAEIAHQLGLFNESKEAYDAHILLKDSLLNEEKIKAISGLEVAYETQLKDQEIAFRKEENTLLDQENKAKRNQNIALGVALLLAVAAGVLLVKRQRSKTKAKQALVDLQKVENEKLSQEISFKNRELTSQALQIAQKNELLKTLEEGLKKIAHGDPNALSEMRSRLKLEQQLNDHWAQFTRLFQETNPAFFQKLKAADVKLSTGETRLAALLKMQMGSKDIASMLNISDEGVKKARYRLRKKLNLEGEDSLEAYLLGL